MAQTPILDALIRHVQKSTIPLHVPGHKQGKLLPREFATWIGHAGKIDLTELPGLDNLQSPEGCIAESQRLAANFYGSKNCFYSVNGSTASVMAAIMACTQPKGRVLFVNPFHMSAWRGLILADAVPVFQSARFDSLHGTHMPPTPESVREALHGVRPDVVYLTSPTYQGFAADVRAIADIVHTHGLPLIVDEAHGAHFGLSPNIPDHSVAEGADVVIHSVHKMLPALTQTSWIHCQGDLVDADKVESCLQMLQSTSPSYLMMASIDAAQAWLHSEGQGVVESTLTLLNEHLPRNLRPNQDPFRDWIPTHSLSESRRLQEQLAEVGAYVEFADSMGVLSVFGLDLSVKHLTVYRTCVQRFFETLPSNVVMRVPHSSMTKEVRWCLTPREAYYAKKRRLRIKDAAGYVAGGLITPYPPGVPIVWPGQYIDDEIRDWLRQLHESDYEVHGITQDGFIVVLEPQR